MLMLPRLKFLHYFALTAILMLFVTGVYATHSHQHKTVEGIEIYLAVNAAEMLQGHPPDHTESEMHSRIRTQDKKQHHIMVSLFNAKTGERLRDTTIRASVMTDNFTGPVRKLELMVTDGIKNYGNFFTFPDDGPFRIKLEIEQRGVTNVIKTEFLISII